MTDILRLDAGSRMSRGVVYNGVLYSAGHVDTKATDVAGQTRNVLRRIDALLTQTGSSRSRILSANVWLADITTFDELNAVWDEWIDKSAPPARATVESKLADPQYKVEISVIAALDAPAIP